MQEVVWGNVPSQRSRKTEQFTSPVITLSSLEAKGAGRKFTFNKACQELMGIQGEDRVSFGFTPDGYHIYLKKVSGTEGFKLTKTCSLSDKRTYEYIAKNTGINTQIENHFNVISASNVGEGVFEMILLEPVFAKAIEVVEFATMELGEISDEPILEADLSAIPETPEGGTIYQEELPTCPSPLEEDRVNIADLVDEETEDTLESADLSAHLEEDEEDAWN